MKNIISNILVIILAIPLIAKTTQNTVFTIVSGLTLGSFLASAKHPQTKIIGGIGLSIGLILGYYLIPQILS
ncbi:hypothetical protein [Thermococcus sp. PK]|jgi:hypothetical protein|uniref:hypothetical protein n=1 Tax=Thermococcus sp. PK TaxID=913025 RepID=UPI0005B2C386|nr:hypothetical protein [Thermococcus sp. PK]HIH73461.1 hypothetical protein [Thermococcaceae archaeon]